MGTVMHAPLTAGPAPKASDRVSDWFDSAMATRLEEAGLPTLAALAQRINQAGPRWWYPVRGLGATKADRVVAWLRTHEPSTGLAVANDAPLRGPQRQNAASSLNATACADFAWLSPSTTLRSPSSFTT